MKNIFIYISFVLLIYGCGSTPIISTETILIDTTIAIPAIADSFKIVASLDSTEYNGTIHNEQGDSIGYLIANTAKGYAKIFVKPDSQNIKIIYKDKDTCISKTTDAKDSVFSLLNWWEESIVFMIIGLLLLWKTKRKVPLI